MNSGVNSTATTGDQRAEFVAPEQMLSEIDTLCTEAENAYVCSANSYTAEVFSRAVGVKRMASAVAASMQDMRGALLGLQVIAEQHITDLAADVQEGRIPDAVWQMEMNRWTAVKTAFAKATGAAS